MKSSHSGGNVLPKPPSSVPPMPRMSPFGLGLLQMGSEKVLELHGRIGRGGWVEFQAMAEIVQVQPLDVEAVGGAGVDLERHLMAGLALEWHRFAAIGRRPIVLLADQYQERRVEPNQ